MVYSISGDVVLGPERTSRSNAVPELRLRHRRSRQALDQSLLCVKLFLGNVELGDDARLGTDKDVVLSATFSELTDAERARLARTVVDLGIFATDGFSPGAPLDNELLA